LPKEVARGEIGSRFSKPSLRFGIFAFFGRQGIFARGFPQPCLLQRLFLGEHIRGPGVPMLLRPFVRQILAEALCQLRRALRLARLEQRNRLVPRHRAAPTIFVNTWAPRLNAGVGRTPEKGSTCPYGGVRGRGKETLGFPMPDDRASEKR